MSKPVVRWMWLIGLLCIPVEAATAQSRTLDIYWVDVEGGAATLVVSPTGESLLVDTGYPTEDDRDAKRIFAAAQEAGLARIDYLVITHFHRDPVLSDSLVGWALPTSGANSVFSQAFKPRSH